MARKSKFPVTEINEASNGNPRLQSALDAIANPPAPKSSSPPRTNQIIIPAPRIQVSRVKIVGVTSLVVSAFPDKLMQQMEEKRETEQSAGKKRATNRPARDFEQEYRDSLYPLDDGSGYGFPANAFKLAMVDACRQVNDITMTLANRLMFVMPEVTSKGFGCVRLIGKPRRRRDMVRLDSPSHPPDVRYRAEFPDWSCWLNIQHNLDMLSVESLFNLLSIAGMSVGVGEMRPSAPHKSNTFGMFRIADPGK